MAEITQTISAVTSLPTPPNPNSPSTFDALAYPYTVAQNAFGVDVNDMATELNTFATQTNAVKDEVNTARDQVINAVSFISEATLVDATPTDGSNNPISSNGVFDALAGKVSKSGDTITGNLVFASGTKIQGDFSNLTESGKTIFQTSMSNSATVIGNAPSGTATVAMYRIYNASDVDNSSNGSFRISAQEVVVGSSKLGSGSYLPLAFHTSDTERLRIGTAGNVLVTGAGGLGYGTGSGGTVTQLTSKSTAVTLNKPCGEISTASDSIPANSVASFTVNNSLVGVFDTIIATLKADNIGGTSSYFVWAQGMFAGQFMIHIWNRTATPLSHTLGLNFAIIKGAIS